MNTMTRAALPQRRSESLRLFGMPCGLFFIGMMVAIGLASCEKADSGAVEAVAETIGNERGVEFRIVSLSPAITDILIDLELGGFVVGRGAWDEQLGAEIPRVGDLSNLDLEALIALGPSDVILQAGRQGTPAALAALAAAEGWNVINRQIDSLDDVVDALDGLVEDLSMGGDAGLRERTRLRQEGLLEDFRRATRPLDEDVAAEWGSVLLLYSTDPPSAFGPGSYLDDVIGRMGLENALTTGGSWQELDAETLMALDPGVILSVKIGSREDAGRVAELGRLGRLPLSAIEDGRCFEVSHPQAHLPGTCVIEVAEQLRGIFVRVDDGKGSSN